MNAHIALIALISDLSIRTDHSEPKTAVPGRSDDQGDGKVAQRAGNYLAVITGNGNYQ